MDSSSATQTELLPRSLTTTSSTTSKEPQNTPSSESTQKKASGEKRRKLPPMLEEYRRCKEENGDHFLFFQVGDFYEVFFEDAPKVAKILNVTLTSRDKKAENPIPMCGVPVGAIEGYLERLVDACLLYTSPSPRDATLSRMPSSA